MTHRPHLLCIALSVALAAPVGLAACGSEGSVSQGSSAQNTIETTVTVAPTPPPTEPAASTTEAPPETAPATTTPAPTDTTPSATGWTIVNSDTLTAPLAFPCCASNWFGEPSPALPAAGTPLADGVYPIQFDWPANSGDPIVATVSRFEQCGLLPANTCEDNSGGVYPPDDLGVDPTASYEWTFMLDGDLQVVLGGFTGFSDSPATSDNFRIANGADLAELLTALDADFIAAITAPVTAGASVEQVIADLVATPAHGFSAPPQEGAGALSYAYGSSPPLLFQGVDPATRGSDIIGRVSLEIRNGRPTLYLYAGFYS